MHVALCSSRHSVLDQYHEKSVSEKQNLYTATRRLKSLTCISELQQEFYSRPVSGYADSGLLPLRNRAHGSEELGGSDARLCLYLRSNTGSPHRVAQNNVPL